MAIHSSIFAWRIPRTEEPGGLQSMGLKRVGHDWMTYKKHYYPSVWLICSSQLCFCSAFHSSCLETVSLNSSSSSNVPPVNFSLTLLPKLKKKPFGFWMTSFIWLPPMADVTGIFCFFPGGCYMACGIFLNQGLNLCLLHWQVDSLPLSQQGSPTTFFKANPNMFILILGILHGPITAGSRISVENKPLFELSTALPTSLVSCRQFLGHISWWVTCNLLKVSYLP